MGTWHQLVEAYGEAVFFASNTLDSIKHMPWEGLLSVLLDKWTRKTFPEGEADLK